MERSERRFRTENIIKKRWARLMTWMMPVGPETKEESQSGNNFTPHHYHKFNGDCGCGSCKLNKYYGKYKREKIKDILINL